MIASMELLHYLTDRVKMFNKKDSRILKSIIPLLDTLIYEANQYKEWIEQMANTGIYLGE